MSTSTRVLYSIVVSALLSVSAGQAKTVHVPEQYATIQDGIDSVSSGDTVLVADGIYSGPGNCDISFYSRRIVLRSENGPDAAIIDCAGSAEQNHRAFYFFGREDSATVVDGFTIQNGYADFKGGAVLIEDSSPTIKNCVFKDNFGHHGGVMYITFDAVPIISNCRFIDNTTGDVGIIHARFGCRAVFSDCDFIGNRAKNGIFLCYNASPYVLRCRFMNNETEATGGAVFLQDGSSPVFSDCLFTGNRTGGRGGGIFIEERGFRQNICSPQFTHCILARNEADTGGAVYALGPVRASFTNCTIFGNKATAGSAVFSRDNSKIPLSFHACIISAHTGSQPCSGVSDAFEFRCSNIFGNALDDWTPNISAQSGVNGNDSVDPKFVSASELDLRLAPDSPCRAAHSPCDKMIGANQ